MGFLHDVFARFTPQPGGDARGLALALQGGGSFGAFTWGALDRLLEHGDLSLEAISGASAGAVNASLVAAGLSEGGPERAREKLATFWRSMSQAAAFLPAATLSGAAFARALPLHVLNPFDLNPLRQGLEAAVDFERLRAEAPVRLLIAATRVSDGSLRIFRNEEITADVVLASACLPMIHRTVEIDGEAYWDGGFVANPPLIPLVQETEAREILVVQAMPNRAARTPATSREIERRLNQIAFNAPLNAEIEALKVAASLRTSPRLNALAVSRIAAEDEIDDLGDENAANLSWTFLQRLRDAGRQAADIWLKERAVV